MDMIIQQMENLNITSPVQPVQQSRPEVAIINTIKFLYEENQRLKLQIEFLKQSILTNQKSVPESIPEWVS